MTKRATQIASYLSSRDVYFYDASTGLRISRKQFVDNLNARRFPKGHVRLYGEASDVMLSSPTYSRSRFGR